MAHYVHSPSNLIAEMAVDRFGAKRVIPIGAPLVGAGAVMFGTGTHRAMTWGTQMESW